MSDSQSRTLPHQPISTTAPHDNLRDLGLTYKLLRRIAAERDEHVSLRRIGRAFSGETVED